MDRLKQLFTKHRQRRMKKRENDSKRVVLEEIFNDIYHDRKRIYKINFIRGVLFGIGSAIGGSIAIALIVWVLSLFVNTPLIGNLFENAQHTIEQSSNDASSNTRE